MTTSNQLRQRVRSALKPVAAAAGAALFATAALAAAPTVQTDKGTVVGTPIAGTNVNAFYGVPFAAPPVGDLRLRAPQPHAPWSTPLQATQQPAPCTQFDIRSDNIVGSEDCLYLNVFTPSTPSLVPRPVMVFIPGGGFTQGGIAEAQYKAQAISQQSGAIVVVVSYRVGALGYLATPALDAENALHVSGNYGQLDQIAALQWVQRNILAFGGNPGNVTLFGESAGAVATEFQLASPLAAGLFEKAIVESSGGTLFIPFLTLAQSEATTGAAELKLLGCDTATDVSACLRALPASKFTSTALVNTTNNYPVVDGWSLKQQPLAAFKSGQFNRVPVITGTNHDEFSTLLPVIFPQFAGPQFTPQVYAGVVQQFFGPGASAVLAQYPASAYPSPLQALSALMTDAGLVCPTEEKRQALDQFVPVFGYEFNEPNPATGTILPPPVPGLTYGDYHTSELPYVFGVDANGIAVTGKDLKLSQEVISYWTNFAYASFPNVFPHAGNPLWPMHASGSLVSLKDTIADLPVATFSNDHKCAFWAASGI